MGRESDYKIKNEREFPPRIKNAIEKGDVQYLAEIRTKVTSRISKLMSGEKTELFQGITTRLNNFMQVIDDALDKACERKTEKV